MANETILITGILGQDGAYLAKHALEKGHHVIGGARRSSTHNAWRLRELGIENDVEIVDFELLELSNIVNTVRRRRPDRIFNLAAQSFVGASFEQPLFTSDVDALGPLRVLEAIRLADHPIRFYQASSSEMFGKVQEVPQKETTTLYPRSPYGVAKVFAHYMTRNYRESYGLHLSSGILFNHESPLRGEEFVTRKITLAFARIKAGLQATLDLGNMDAERDWGHARDYVKGMWLMTDQPTGGEYVLATGEKRTVRAFVELAAQYSGFDIVFEGQGVDEVGRDRSSGRVLVKVDPAFFRPAEVDLLIGDASKAEQVLGWRAEMDLEGLAREMVEADLRRINT